MSIPPKIVYTVKKGWKWQWLQLMNGLAPADKNGNFQRVPSQKNNAHVPDEKDLENRERKDLPLLIIGRSCPWAHRTWLIYELRGLRDSLNLCFAKADKDGGRWLIEPEYIGCKSLLEIYQLCGTSPTFRATVPALIDPMPNNKYNPILLGNESAQLLEVLNQWPTKKNAPDLYPTNLKKEIDYWSTILQFDINDGVYKCGFARNQSAYNFSSNNLFKALSKVETCLSAKGPWLCGKDLTLADIKLFPTLIRWEVVYSTLFKCTKEPLWIFPNIWEWRQKFLELPNVSRTCNSFHWTEDYFGALFPLNPSNIIPNVPELKKIVFSPLQKF